MASTAHPLPDAWLGTRLQLAIRDLAVVNGYADSLSARLAGRHANTGLTGPGRTFAVASIMVTDAHSTLLFRPLALMEPNAFSALITDRSGMLVWQEDTDHPSYYEAYDLVRRAFAARSPRSAAANASRWRAPSLPMIPLRMPEPTGRIEGCRA